MWLPDAWQCWRPVWTGLWATKSSERHPSPWQGAGTKWTVRSLSTKTILWLFSDSFQWAPTEVDRIGHSRIWPRKTSVMNYISMCAAAAAMVPQIPLWHMRAWKIYVRYCHFEPAHCCAGHNSFKYFMHFEWKICAYTWHCILISQRHYKGTRADMISPNARQCEENWICCRKFCTWAQASAYVSIHGLCNPQWYFRLDG